MGRYQLHISNTTIQSPPMLVGYSSMAVVLINACAMVAVCAVPYFVAAVSTCAMAAVPYFVAAVSIYTMAAMYTVPHLVVALLASVFVMVAVPARPVLIGLLY